MEPAIPTETDVIPLGLEEILNLRRISDLPGVGRFPACPLVHTDQEWEERNLRWGERMDRIESLTGWPAGAILRIEALEDRLEEALKRVEFETARADRLAAIR